MTSNVGQNYPYTSETEAERAAAITSLLAKHEDLRGKLVAETTPLDANDRWWVWKCPTPGCPASSTSPATPPRSTPSSSSATGPAARRSCADPAERTPPGRPGASTASMASMTDDELRTSRRRLATDAIGIGVSAAGFGFVYGLSARGAGFSPIEAMAMSTIVFAGAAQFAAVGYVASGLAWPGIVLLTALLNARHLLYSAALAPWLRDVPVARRAVMAHLLTDEAFALSISHFRRIGRGDERGYWLGAIVATFIPWNLATLGGVLLGAQIPEPARFGIDVIFPAAMIGLAVGLVTGRRELVAAIVGARSLSWSRSHRARPSGSSRAA